MNKKTLKINISKLSIGGMEHSFLNFLKMSDLTKEYDTTILIGYVTNPELIKQIPKNIKYHVITKKWNLLGKLHTGLYLACQIIKTTFLKNRYDCAIAYSYQHGSLAKLTRNESNNNIIFIHTNLLESRSPKQLKHLIRKTKPDRFSKVICVSNNATSAFKKIFPHFRGKTFTINNFINEQEIIQKSKEPITFHKRTITFLNVCRHENDNNKKVSRILEAAKRLKEEGEQFEVLLIGEGKEDEKYRTFIKQNQLSNYVKMLGIKSNPFPYYKKADAVIMSSAYEGYGIILDEARVLKTPIISTDVGDAKEILLQGYGILCANNSDGVYSGMKTFLNNPPRFRRDFSAKSFNDIINQMLNQAIN